MTKARLILIISCLLFLMACGSSVIAKSPEDGSTPTLTPVQDNSLPPASGPGAGSPAAPGTTVTSLPASLGLDPANWHAWPVLPIVPARASEIFLIGQSLGRDAHAFSVFGDCQTEPDVFMGVYETDQQLVASLSQDLQGTVAWFTGSFNRDAPTTEGGATTAALLWAEWHHNKFTCTSNETPLQCELRIHNPAFVIIQVGSHYETRNDQYMRMILDQLIEAGVVPILATKADNRDQDEHINAQYALLAVEYNIPFWNFWAAVQDLPNHGLYTLDWQTHLGDIYLTTDASSLHRLTALQSLDLVRRGVGDP